MIRRCRSCFATTLVRMFSLGSMPPVNAFISPEDIGSEQAFPLDLVFCRRCGLVQLGKTVNPARLFSHYLHMSSASQSNVNHLSDVAAVLRKEFGSLHDKEILEVGSNDGTLLMMLKENGAKALGVDPARNLIEKTRREGVTTLQGFFTRNFARATLARRAPFDAVVALNVVAHTPDFISLLHGVYEVLSDKGIFMAEVAYAIDTILKGQFDTIYHEHVYCFSLHSLSYAMRKVGLQIVKAEIIPTQGTSLRIFAVRVNQSRKADISVEKILENEKVGGYMASRTYERTNGLVKDFRKNFLNKLRGLKRKHGPLIGLGAPARGVVIANYCDLNRELLKYVIDDTPLKQGKLVGGIHVPVVGWDALRREASPAFVLLSWNYRKEILRKLAPYHPHAPILVPFPRMEVLPQAAMS